MKSAPLPHSKQQPARGHCGVEFMFDKCLQRMRSAPLPHCKQQPARGHCGAEFMFDKSLQRMKCAPRLQGSSSACPEAASMRGNSGSDVSPSRTPRA